MVLDLDGKILKGLNPSQKEAVLYDGGPLLILAGAGSGKTRVLTHRIAYLLSQGVLPHNIFGVTFTNKAASEMRHRVRSLVDREVWIGTFHSTCLQILRQEAVALNLPRNFQVYDDQDQLTLIKQCLRELNLMDTKFNPRALRETISRAKDELKGPAEVAAKGGDYFADAAAKVYELYQRKLFAYQGLDFGDLIMRAVLLVERDERVRNDLQNRFQHILVDEYQDTNHAQYRLIKLLAAKNRKLTVVGDPDQSIYRWRGADIRNILNFEEDYSDARWIKLEQNYRSTSTILEASNSVIQNNLGRKHKELWSDHGKGDPVSLFQGRDEKEEAMYVVRTVNHSREAGLPLREMAVFYRVHAQSRVMEDLLRRFRIPYRIVGGVRFYDRKEIKDLVGYLRVMLNSKDEVSLKRILNVPQRGIGKKSIEKLEELCRVQAKGLYEILEDPASVAKLPAKARNASQVFMRQMEYFKSQSFDLSPQELMELVLEKSGMLLELQRERTIEAETRVENLKEFLGAAAEYEESTETRPENLLADFIESVTLQSNLDQYDPNEDMLTLMSLHTAKGLEFREVFMVGMEEGLFPHINSLNSGGENVEEERRLCYVGMTRAKKKLHMTFAESRRLYGNRQYNLPSRFLNEVPHQLFGSQLSLDDETELETTDNDLDDGDIFIDWNDES